MLLGGSDQTRLQRNLGPSLSPSTVERDDFLSPSTQTTSPPSIRSIPRPPPAAPAAGGRGIDGSRRVHSVGLSRAPAGGVEAEEARSDWFLQVVVLPLVGGAPRSSGAELPPSSSSRISRSCWLGFPSTGFRGTAGPDRDLPRDVDVHWRDDDGDLRRRSFGIGDRRLPAGLGMLLIQGIERSMSGGAPLTALRRLRRGRVAQGLGCNFVSSEGLCVICPM